MTKYMYYMYVTNFTEITDMLCMRYLNCSTTIFPIFVHNCAY